MKAGAVVLSIALVAWVLLRLVPLMAEVDAPLWLLGLLGLVTGVFVATILATAWAWSKR